MEALFTIYLHMDGERHHVDYDSIDECLADRPLAKQLDDHGTEAVLWVGSLRLTGKPLRSSRELREALVSNANTILRRIL